MRAPHATMGRIALCALWIAASTLHSAAAAEPDGPAPALIRVAREIQNVCFSEYPDSLVRAMSGHEGPIPEDVREDPDLRQRFLRSEEIVAKGLFYPSLLDDLLPALSAAIRPGDRFLDLGSGDGRVVFIAAHLGARATGIEYDRALQRIARRARRRLAHLFEPDRAILRRGDFFREDLSRYDRIFYFGRGSFGEDRLLAKIRAEMRADALLLLYRYPGNPPGLDLVAAHGPVRILRVASRP